MIFPINLFAYHVKTFNVVSIVAFRHGLAIKPDLMISSRTILSLRQQQLGFAAKETQLKGT